MSQTKTVQFVGHPMLMMQEVAQRAITPLFESKR